ncbi:MAG: hypothetical protein ABI574_15650 [Burkholderiales bacterium]
MSWPASAHRPERRPAVAARPAVRGTGSLAVLLVLLLAASLVLLYANRALIFEQRASAQQARTVAALAAAEAGLAWTLALLNHPGAVTAACTPSPSVSAASDGGFAARYLQIDATLGSLAPSVAAQPACVADGSNAWSCACPAAGSAALSPAALGRDLPGFAIRFATGPRPRTLWLQVDGCSGAGSECGSSLVGADAVVHTEVLLATLGAVARPPYAALTARDAVSVQGDAVVANTDAAQNGVTIDAAAAITLGPSVQLLAAPGSDPTQSLLPADPGWLDAGGSVVSPARFFSSHFALARSQYKAQPTLRRLNCTGSCGDADLAAALDTGARLLWVEGGLALASAASWGSREQPLLLIVEGTLTLTGPVQWQGLAYAGSVAWSNASGALARLDGALVSEGALQLDGRIQVRRDADILARLRDAAGLFAPVAGSWRDFRD